MGKEKAFASHTCSAYGKAISYLGAGHQIRDLLGSFPCCWTGRIKASVRLEMHLELGTPSSLVSQGVVGHQVCQAHPRLAEPPGDVFSPLLALLSLSVRGVMRAMLSTCRVGEEGGSGAHGACPTPRSGCTFHQPEAWQERTGSPSAAMQVWGFCGLRLPANPIWPRLRNLAWVSPGWRQCVWMPCPYSRVIG